MTQPDNKSQRKDRNWHKNFIDYMKVIVNHKNYADMPKKFKEDGGIKWVSPSDKERAKWWDKRVKKMGLKNRAEVARAIHPKKLKGLKPCQICGREMSIFYIYPNKNTLKKILGITSEVQFKHYKTDIYAIFNDIYGAIGDDVYSAFTEIFDIPNSVSKDKDSYLDFITKKRTSRLSPGVMSNAPDRLDGFHTYNACCRSEEDTGRHRSNLARYTQDRRAYENWAEGNWNLANRLMGEFNRYKKHVSCAYCGKVRKITADHIGPLSLGFTHRPKFAPLCKHCNSRKNNRLYYEDVQELIKDEKTGKKVVSWHSKYIWDLLKHKVKNRNNAIRLSSLMRRNLHHALIIFSMISEKGHDDFLKRFLNPKYSYFDYKFKDFNPIIGTRKIIKKSLDSTNKRKNAKRYIRISFESLHNYKQVKNRNTKIWKSGKVDFLLKGVFSYLEEKKYNKAESQLRKVFNQLAQEAVEKF